MPKTKIGSDDQVLILEHGLKIMCNIYDVYTGIYDQLRIKVLSMIAAQLVIVSFIFNGWKLEEVNFTSGIWIIFGFAVVLQVIPLILMMWALSPLSWTIPGDAEKYKGLTNKYEDYQEYLVVMHGEYESCVNDISKPVNRRSAAFSYVLYSLSLSVIILLVLKIGG